jgi:GNAT superfamily N-acetyltransferase
MALSADLVGTRVVVRVVVRGELGPSGGPAMRDILGTLTAWDVTHLSVERSDGSVEVIAQADVVTAKPVPPRASVRQRVPADVLELICSRGWQPPDTERLGDWTLRAAGGFTGRANSALVVGDPGVPLDDALQEVVAFYTARGLPPQAQVVVDSPDDAALAQRGWVSARSGQVAAIVQVASVAMAVRRRSPDATTEPVAVGEAPSDEWIDRYERSGHAPRDLVRAVLGSGDSTAFASVGDPIAAIGRGVVTDDWIGLSAVEVVPGRRRAGLGTAIVSALLEWGASLGARSAYVQARPDNLAALALYAPFGFATHHAYRYLRPA